MEWAKTARLVRVSSTKLMTVKKNAALAERPLDLVLALLEAYPRLGVVVLDREARSVTLTDLGRYAVRRVRGMAQPGDPVLQLRVTLAGVDGPPVWRQVVIPASYTLDRVHGVIQAAMGWQNSHLHMFRIAGREYGPAYLDDELETLDEKQFRIGDLVKAGDLAGYEYDLGDGWEHEVAVEAGAAADAATVYPECIAGEGACPPEDCGGPGGFAELKELLAGPPSLERKEMRVWAGEDYDAAHFDLAAANTAAGSI